MDSSAGSPSAKAERPLVSKIRTGPQARPAQILLRPNLDSGGFFAQPAQFAKASHPRLLGAISRSRQFLLDRLGDKLAERNPALGCDGFCLAKNKIRDFDSSTKQPQFAAALWNPMDGEPDIAAL